jgi:hypothetical protein
LKLSPSFSPRLQGAKVVFCSRPKKKLPRHSLTYSMALALEEVQEGLPHDRSGPFGLSTRHRCSCAREEEARPSKCWCVGGGCTRSPESAVIVVVVVPRLGFVEYSTAKPVTQSDSAAQTSTTSQIIHSPWPSANPTTDTDPIGVLRET